MKEDEIVLLHSWKEVMKGFLDPLEFIEALPNQFPLTSEAYHRILVKRKEPHAAVEIAIETVMESDIAFQDFIEAIRNIGHEWLADLISGNIKDDEVEDAARQRDQESLVRKYLTIIAPKIKETIFAIDVASKLEHPDYGSLITREDFERINCKTREEGNQASVRILLIILTRKPTKWWVNFTKALKDLNYDHDLVESLESISADSGTHYASSDINGEDHIVVNEKGLHDDAARPPRPQSKPKHPLMAANFTGAASNAQSGAHARIVKHDPVNLREYQRYLADAAIAGANVIICAPTGSGKTRVAAHIIHSRFNSNLSTKSPKVAFIVPRVALAKQQQDSIKSFLRSEKWCVDYLIGDSKVTLREALHMSNVIVMTPQILLNGLKDGSVPSLKVFKLIIFDECHHTMKEMPYNSIMLHYLQMKHNKCDDLPQIIGLTATLGVGRGKLDASAVEHVMTLCANLDATGGIVTVPIPLQDELNQCTPQPEEDNVLLEGSISDPFTSHMCEAIDQLVRVLYSLNIARIKGVSKPSPLPKGDQQYLQWCQDFQTKAVNSLADEPDLSRDIQTCIDYIRIFNESLDLNLKCRATDALKFLENKLSTVSYTRLSATEGRLHDVSERFVRMLKQDLCDPRCKNPNLEQIGEEILKTFEGDKNSRVMLNVLKRQYAEPIRDWLNESEELKVLKLNAEYFTGVGRNKDGSRGLTHNKQEQMLEMFRSGAIKALVCTPAVASEGVDIVDCNLVISYDYVKNEVSKTQLKGRARKEHGRMVQFSSRKVMQRDKSNIAKTLLMEKTTLKVQLMSTETPEEYKRQLLQLQKEVVFMAQLTRQSKGIANGSTTSSKFNATCKKCSVFVCSANDIVKLEGTNHTCVTNNFKRRYTEKIVDDGGTEVKKGLFCKKCDSRWGIFSRYKRILIPQLYPKAFKFVDDGGSTTTPITGSQWNKIAIEFKSVSYGELYHIMFQEDL